MFELGEKLHKRDTMATTCKWLQSSPTADVGRGNMFRGAMVVQGDGQAQANILSTCSKNQYSPVKVHKKSLVNSVKHIRHTS